MDYVCDECGMDFEHDTPFADIIVWDVGEPYCPYCGCRLSGY